MSLLSLIPTKIKALILGIAAALLSVWWAFRKERKGRERAEAERDAAKRDVDVAKVETEAARGDAAVAEAERTVIVEAMDDQAAGAAAAHEVTRAAAEVVDHPDRAAARARVRLSADVPDADDREDAGGGDTAELPPPRR